MRHVSSVPGNGWKRVGGVIYGNYVRCSFYWCDDLSMGEKIAMGRKKKEIDNLAVCSTAALAEGLSYGKYMAKYNCRPPCLVGVEAVPIVKVETEKRVRNCKWCGKEFNVSHGSQYYCCYDHQRAANQERQRCVAERDRANRKCAVCGGAIPGDRSLKAKYCSKKCKMMADNAARRAKKMNKPCQGKRSG